MAFLLYEMDFSIISYVLLQNWTIRIISFAPNFFSCYTERKAYLIRTAIKDCIDNHILEDFFRENVEKVVKVMVLDYTWERREELIREEEYEDGKQAGIEIGKRTGIEIGTEQGIAQGTSLLEAAIEDLCAGKTITELEAAGYDQKIIQKAQNIINKHFNKE